MLRKMFIGVVVILIMGVGFGGWTFMGKYHARDEMLIPVEEVTTAAYPEDPSHRSIRYDRYRNRVLRLVKRDDSHFDFIFESKDPNVATVAAKNIDLRLLIPVRPKWASEDKDLEIIALTDREWNRQQVSLPVDSSHVSVKGGDGFEEKELVSVGLARNCLNAGLWEVMLYAQEDGKKAMYYQGWFEFPLGHYKRVFERENGISYWKHWYRLEHWWNPQGKRMALGKLRIVVEERKVSSQFDPHELLIAAGEQLRKARTVDASGVRCWGDFCAAKKVRFATFVPPGRYSVKTPWKNEFHRIANFRHAIIRKVKPSATSQILDEVELVFSSGKNNKEQRFIVSGIDLHALPQLPEEEYPKGLYMPMGISVPPFYQSYEALKQNPPYKSPYFCVLVDSDSRWINHHDVAIDGPVMHRDIDDPDLVHLYLLSYERHTLVGHYKISLR